ncbi:MAG: head maturation protease, ClpP-related [Sarcina sp.]
MNKILELKNKDKLGNLTTVGKMEIKNQLDNKADLYFYGDICSSTWDCWMYEDKCPQDISDFLKNIENNSEVNIYINSGGGSVSAGIAIYNQLRRFSGHKIVHIDGFAASIASIIALAGDEVIIPSSAQFMIHKPWSWGMGNVHDFEKTIDMINVAENSIINIYKEHLNSDTDIETIKNFMEEEKWFTGEEACKYFDMQLEDSSQIVACSSSYFDKYKNTPDGLKEDKQKDETSKSNTGSITANINIDEIANKLTKIIEDKKEEINKNKIEDLKEKLAYKSKNIASFLLCNKEGME